MIVLRILLTLASILLTGVTAGTQTLTQITFNGGTVRDCFPSVSADGRLFCWQSLDGIARIHRIQVADTWTLKTWTAATVSDWNLLTTLSGDGSTIAMVKNGDLFVVPATGGVPRNVTNYGGFLPKVQRNCLSLSHDGRMVCYEVNLGFRYDLMIMDLATNRVTTITGNHTPVPNNVPAQISGDGKTVVYAAINTHKGEIWAAATDGTKIRPLTNFGYTMLVYGPRVDHFGKAAVFELVPSFPNSRGIIYSVATDGSGLQPLTPLSVQSNRGTRMAADGDRITFHSNRASRGDVFMAFPDGTGVRRLTTMATFPPNGQPEGVHALNGDGTVAVFCSNANPLNTNPELDPETFLWKDALTRTGAARPGARVTLHLEDTAGPGAAYMVRCAFGRTGGIRIPGSGTIPLTPDGLFRLSGQAPSIFRNFSGRLDSAGRATATVAIPNWKALSGLSFFASFITMAPSSPVTVHNPVKITIS